MARGINKVILIGTLGQDPETRYMPSGGAITNISLATNETWKDKHTGQPQERTEWHRVVTFNKLAEIAGEYLRKGTKTYIEGSLRTRKWRDQSGNDRYITEIVASTMEILGSSRKAPMTPQEAEQAEYQRSQQQAQAQPQSPQQPGGFDDDIPFRSHP